VELYDKGDIAAARVLHETVKRFRLTVQDYAPIPAQKRLLAMSTGDRRWANLRPPLMAMPQDKGRELAERLKREFEFSMVPA